MACLICDFNKSREGTIEDTLSWQIDIPVGFEFPGLFFIKTKRHVESLAGLTDKESSEIGGLIQKYSKKSYKIAKAQRVLAMSLGLSEPHIHFWIVPMTTYNRKEVLKIRKVMRQLVEKYK